MLDIGMLDIGIFDIGGKTWVVGGFYCKDAEVEEGRGGGGEIQEMMT
jgi:hypothetical protein